MGWNPCYLLRFYLLLVSNLGMYWYWSCLKPTPMQRYQCSYPPSDAMVKLMFYEV
jgi:hypothetical protein